MNRWWLWLISLPLGAQSAPPLVLTTHEMPPYSMAAAGGVGGLATRRVDCALQALQRPYQLQLLPWKRAQHEVQAGRADGFFAGARNAERDRYAQASVVIAPQVWTWFQLEDASVQPTDADFRSRATVASFLGAAMYDHLKEQGYPRLEQARNMEQLTDWLLTGKVDAVLAADLVMAHHLQLRGISSGIRSIAYQDKPLVLYFSKQRVAAEPDLLPSFNQAVSDCIAAEQRSDG